MTRQMSRCSEAFTTEWDSPSSHSAKRPSSRLLRLRPARISPLPATT